MRVLAHIHTFNDEDVIEQALAAMQRQTRPPDAIVVVDNASTDRTLDRTFPENVTVIRNRENLGTSGAIHIGLAYALQHNFDWAWLFDADSVPEPDALANLLAFFQRLPPSEGDKVCFLACRLARSGEADHRPMVLTESGVSHIPLNADTGDYQCDCFLWSGSLFRIPAVARIGLPSADYVLDLGELEYGYRARQMGFSSYVVSSSILHHDVGRAPGAATRIWRFGPLSFRLYELSPPRCYYRNRNMLYFWLYQRRPIRPSWFIRSIVNALLFPRTFAVRPFTHYRHVVACLRGFWDGVTGNIERRY